MFKPMLAGQPDYTILRYPLFASTKIDGLRCRAERGVAISRSNKPLPNKHLQRFFAEHADMLEGMDGEIIIGAMNANDVYRKTASGVMSDEGEPDFAFWVFDLMNIPEVPFTKRYQALCSRLPYEYASLLPQNVVHDENQLLALEAHTLARGYEGLILRDPHALYKQGRATARSQELLKVKRFTDAEAEIIGIEEEMHNGNEAQTNELGRTKRSSHQDNKTGKGTLGALVCRTPEGIEFRIGTGFTAEMRASMWGTEIVIGKIAKYKHFPIGAKDAPRHPVFLGLRNPLDMEEAA